MHSRAEQNDECELYDAVCDSMILHDQNCPGK